MSIVGYEYEYSLAGRGAEAGAHLFLVLLLDLMRGELRVAGGETAPTFNSILMSRVEYE